jgi:hypothetical protein
MDIETIKKKLKDYEEITDVFDLKYMSDIKYITLTKDGDEKFFDGGKYIRMGDNKILIKKGYISVNIPIEYRLKDGQVYYKTRFFMKEHLQMTQNNFNELLEVVESQQQVINKLFKKTKKYEKLLGL